MPTSLHAQNRTLEIDDLRLEVDLATPVLSPDGSQVIVRVSTPNYDDNRIERTLILVDIATGAQRELTPHRRGVGGAPLVAFRGSTRVHRCGQR